MIFFVILWATVEGRNSWSSVRWCNWFHVKRSCNSDPDLFSLKSAPLGIHYAKNNQQIHRSQTVLMLSENINQTRIWLNIFLKLQIKKPLEKRVSKDKHIQIMQAWAEVKRTLTSLPSFNCTSKKNRYFTLLKVETRRDTRWSSAPNLSRAWSSYNRNYC
jgi:hypothetical protein